MACHQALDTALQVARHLRKLTIPVPSALMQCTLPFQQVRCMQWRFGKHGSRSLIRWLFSG